MAAMHWVLRGGLAFILVLTGTSCGGGNPPGSESTGSSGTVTVAAASNVVSVVVDGGPTANMPNPNTLYTTVTLCVPGSTTECQTIDHIQVDTGSYGLRLLAPVLTLALPIAVASNGNSLLECTQFADLSYSWGPVATADIQVSGETASSVPVQVIGDSSFSVVPDACANGGTAEDTVASFGANGIIGIGVFAQDCGATCVSDPGNGFYYGCTPGGDCVGVQVALTAQVLNPVPLFGVDNNGTIIELPSVAEPGAATLTGSLIFGIDTESNNASGTQTVITLDPDAGTFTTVYGGQTLASSFLDTGSNGIFFSDSDITQCGAPDVGFYCPTSTESFTASITGQNAVSATIDFSIGNAETIIDDNPSFEALPSLGGTYSSANTFDWGLPFYYGRRVATAIEGFSTAVNTGPYVAF